MAPLIVTNNFLLKKLDLISGDINRVIGRINIILAEVKATVDFSSHSYKNTVVILKQLENLQNKSSIKFKKVRIDNIIIEGDIKKVNIDFLQQVTYTLEATDRKGNSAKVESVVWELTDPSIATLEVNKDNQLEATVKGVKGVTGVTVVRATADARFGAEVNNLIAEDALNVTDPEASVLSLKASEAVDQE